VRLGLAAFHRDQLCEKAHPVLMRLSGEIAAATWLAVLDRRELKVFLVDQGTGPNDPMFGGHLGESQRLHCTALGKTIMANLSQDIALSALEKSGLTRYTRRNDHRQVNSRAAVRADPPIGLWRLRSRLDVPGEHPRVNAAELALLPAARIPARRQHRHPPCTGNFFLYNLAGSWTRQILQ
jgi:hypothetical protein